MRIGKCDLLRLQRDHSGRGWQPDSGTCVHRCCVGKEAMGPCNGTEYQRCLFTGSQGQEAEMAAGQIPEVRHRIPAMVHDKINLKLIGRTFFTYSLYFFLTFISRHLVLKSICLCPQRSLTAQTRQLAFSHPPPPTRPTFNEIHLMTRWYVFPPSFPGNTCDWRFLPESTGIDAPFWRRY